jgi:hypothetical protein
LFPGARIAARRSEDSGGNKLGIRVIVNQIYIQHAFECGQFVELSIVIIYVKGPGFAEFLGCGYTFPGNPVSRAQDYTRA